MFWIVASALAEPVCPSSNGILAGALESLLEADLSASEDKLTQTLEAWNCTGAPVSTADWQRYALIQGALLHYQGSPDARAWFAVATPDAWLPIMGSTLQNNLEAATGTSVFVDLAVRPEVPETWVYVDGSPRKSGSVELGPHLVELRGPTTWITVVDLRDGYDIVHPLEVPLPEPLGPVVRPEDVPTLNLSDGPPKPHRGAARWVFPAVTVAGGATLVAGIMGSIIGHNKMVSAGCPDGRLGCALLSERDFVAAKRGWQQAAVLGYSGLAITGGGVVLTVYDARRRAVRSRSVDSE